jgi:hypothetical protein
MNQYIWIAQAMIALSIFFVWIVRYHNIVAEFHQYGFSDFFRNFIGMVKMSLATLIAAGIWYPKLAAYPALLMAALMLAAQITHFRAKNPIHKYIPSFCLFWLSLFVAASLLHWINP